ncbi:MAG: S-adenosyl-l-methionine hydroxide adenosyltransferase [Dehalococcoidia bacterium]|nr:S-adenosyl-l-methionine hydroxide adenosyltransferase [Dehalococcoidia bacterium]
MAASPSTEPRPNGIVTLLTDFGLGDAYVAAVKGAVLSVAPSARLVDVTHLAPPQDVHHGAFVLGQAWRAFPPGTAHLVVVDPGVGTARRPLLLVGEGHSFVGPDNGLFTYVLWPRLMPRQPDRKPFSPFSAPVPEGFAAYVLDQPGYWRQPVSATFHARDVFGPVAAHLVAGVRSEQLGTPTDRVTALSVPRAEWEGDVLEGLVLHADTYGNLLTNVPADAVAGRTVEVTVAWRTIRGVGRTYAEREGLTALVGSNGFLEIAAAMGSAARELGVGVGAAVRVQRQ